MVGATQLQSHRHHHPHLLLLKQYFVSVGCPLNPVILISSLFATSHNIGVSAKTMKAVVNACGVAREAQRFARRPCFGNLPLDG